MKTETEPVTDPEAVTDDELTALALAADPDAPLDDDAVPFTAVLDPDGDRLLPDWYMPVASVSSGRLLTGWRRRVVMFIIAAFLLINAYGLCSTYGVVRFG